MLAYLREEHAGQLERALWTRRVVLAADPDLTERVYRGWRGVGYRQAEAGFVVAIYPREEWVALLFEHGAALPDPDGVLLGDGSQTRFLRVEETTPELARVIVAYVRQAVVQRLLDR